MEAAEKAAAISEKTKASGDIADEGSGGDQTEIENKLETLNGKIIFKNCH